MSTEKTIPAQHSKELISLIKARFEKYPGRHENIQWEQVQAKLTASPVKLWSLNQMELSGGEPDVVGFDADSGEFIFYDCAAESPRARRSICYDGQALNSRKQNKPASSAVEMAEAMGVSLLGEVQYRQLQQLGSFDLKTSSWIATPADVRKLGGALFCDRRFDRVFVYHNGADSYYAARGFRGELRV